MVWKTRSNEPTYAGTVVAGPADNSDFGKLAPTGALDDTFRHGLSTSYVRDAVSTPILKRDKRMNQAVHAPPSAGCDARSRSD